MEIEKRNDDTNVNEEVGGAYFCAIFYWQPMLPLPLPLTLPIPLLLKWK